MAQGRELVVYDEGQLTQTINMYVMQGFVVASREPDSVTLVKRKEFSVLWAVIGFFFCLLPLLIYLIVYATQQDQVVFVRVAAPVPGSGGGGVPGLSPDRKFWWDGTAWQDAGATPPPTAQRSPDGAFWWDGVEWRPVRRAIN
jgi:hypothetical protein